MGDLETPFADKFSNFSVAITEIFECGDLTDDVLRSIPGKLNIHWFLEYEYVEKKERKKLN